MQCPDENLVAEFAQQLLPEARAREIEDHVDSCEKCRSLLVAVTRSSNGNLAAASVTVPKEGEIIADKYRVERVIGVGGMGVVVAATHVLLDRVVAVKLMHVDTLSSPDAIERFMREARVAARLESEHAARVTDLGLLENGAPFFVMEHLEGEDTSRLVARTGPLPPHTAALYVMQACNAVSEAHRLGVIHRDIKPSNLFLTKRPDGTSSIKVVDFGLSKVGARSELSLTRSHAVLGSPFFMAPEQLLSAREVDARADVWALGATLHFLLTGKPPFQAQSLPELSAAVLRDAPAPLPATVPAELAQIVSQCLQKDPGRRPATAADLAQALARWTRAPSAKDRLGAPARTRRRPSVRMIAAITVAIAALGVVVFALGRQTTAAAHARPVVLLMDTPVAHGVYSGTTPDGGKTNADDLNDLLRDLPVTLVKEALPSTWDREMNVATLQPDLVVIHRSALFHAINAEFELGYPPWSDEQAKKRWFLLYRVADDKLIAFLGLIATLRPQTRFLVYSRGTDGRWPDPEYRKHWVADVGRRFPALQGHITTMLIAGGVEGGSFSNPAVANEIRSDVKTILGLR